MSRFIEVLRSEIADLERKLEGDPTYVKLREARRLLAVYASADGRSAPAVVSTPIQSTKHVAEPARLRQFSGNSAAALDAAKRFVTNLGRPAKTTEVLEAIAQVGITFGGNAPQNTLSSIMSKSADFKSLRGVGWVLTSGTSKELADDANPTKETSSAMSERQDDFLTEPLAQGHGAEIGGGT